MAATLAVESVLAPADFVRRRLLRALGAFARPLMIDRDLRVAIMGMVVVVTAFATTLAAPLWMLAIGPVVFGVPHLVADLRYVWVRPGYHRRGALWIAAVPPLLVGAATGRVVPGLVAACGALVVARAPARRRALGIAVTAVLAIVAARFGGIADVLFAHLHNVIALALWWAWRPRSSRRHWLPLAAFAALSAALLLGTAAPLANAANGPTLAHHLHQLAPGVRGDLALRLVLSFCFAQSVHYGVWLRLVPEDDRARATPRTFLASFRALRADLGGRTLAICAGGAIVLAVWAAFDLARARVGYLRFAAFHGQLELVAIALLWVEGRRACTRS